MSKRELVLQTLILALGPNVEQATDAALSSKYRQGDAVAQYIDNFLVEAQNTGLLDADDYWGSESWNEAIEAVREAAS